MTYQKLTKISASVQRSLQQLLHEYARMTAIVDAIVAKGGRVLLVGGAVRDLLLDLPVKDIDCEVHGISLDQLEAILREFGPVSLVGKSFGVLRVHGLEGDFAVPRRDSAGRKPHVQIDEQLSIEDAFRRRDLTMNAMGIDLTTFELIDPFDCQADIIQHRLRTPDPAFFVQDPLRFFRVMQFIGRFEMMPDAQLDELCRTMSLAHISRERIETEFEKLFLKSKQPSRGIRWLQAIGRLQEILPELAATVGVAQNPAWHPEGDVFEHTMQALDAAARFDYADDEQKLLVMYAVLCHDLGKPQTSKIIDGVIRSFGHETAGVPLAKALLNRITHKKDLIDGVEKLVAAHMLPGQFVSQKVAPSAYKRLARKLYPQVNMKLLALVSRADKLGRNGAGHEPLNVAVSDVDQFLAHAAQAHVELKPEEPILLGKDLLDVVQPGKQLGDILKQVYEIQINENIADKDELRQRAMQLLSKKK